MPYQISDPPSRIKKLPKHAQRIWISAYNSAYEQYDKDEEKANRVAWSAVKRVYRKDKNGNWVRRKKASFSFPICLSETKIKKTMEIHILPVGEWKHEKYGDIKITEQDIQDFVDNFDKGIRRGVSITEGHDNGMSGGELPAIGWFKKLTNKGKKGLWGTVEWTEKGRELLEQKAYKYFSPEFFSVYEDPETHRVYNNVLTGGALTNSPYFKGLKSIVMSEIMDQFNLEKNMSKETKDEKNLSEDEETDEIEENEEDGEFDEKEKEEEEKDEELEENDEEASEETDKEEESEDDDLNLSEAKKFVKWTRAQINDLPDSSFAYIESGGKKDKEGKTVPRSLRHLPYKDANGKIDLPHLRNAIARAPHVKDKNGNKLPESLVKSIQKKLQALLAKTKKKSSEKNLSEEKKQDKIVYQVMQPGDVDLEQKKDLSEFKKELLRIGEWRHSGAEDGVLKVTMDTLKSIVKNFKDKVLDNIFVPLGHPTSDDPSKNVGEVIDLAIDGEKLMSTIDVKDESVVEKIKKGLIKGISASLVENYIKKDTNEDVGPTLFHAALVSEPYIKGMSDFAPVPLSEEWKDSKIIHIFNVEEIMTLEEIGKRIKKIEEKLQLSEDETSEDETEEEETTEEKSEEETSTEDESKEDESKSEEKETSEEETSEEDQSESSKDSDKAEEEEEEKSEDEESETEESESEAEEAKEEVELAEAEKMFSELLNEGRVTPAEKELLLPLLVSDTEIELSEGKKVASGKALYQYLKSQSPKFSLSEEGTMLSDKKVKKEAEVPVEIDEKLEKMGFSDQKDKKEIYEDFKKEKEGEK